MNAASKRGSCGRPRGGEPGFRSGTAGTFSIGGGIYLSLQYEPTQCISGASLLVKLRAKTKRKKTRHVHSKNPRVWERKLRERDEAITRIGNARLGYSPNRGKKARGLPGKVVSGKPRSGHRFGAALIAIAPRCAEERHATRRKPSCSENGLR